ncbi:hypothetical protein [Spirosoma sp.]|uniref:hypothetical protein n=1 Tax=Spirosoma sp. TaxID=1899569 RepID=UPI002609F9A1|nr:hypothetical protein [Spirosoma sp.]MCX6217603.1 hypothetical protein [Spirosoma sp.]
MLLKELFKTLAIRAGVPETDAKLVETIDALPELDVDDDIIVKPITGNLITESEAQNRPEIKKVFTAQALNGIDAQVDAVLADLFEGPELESFKTDNKATSKKIAKLVARAKELKSSSKPADQTELNKTITQLNETIDKLKTDHEGVVTTLRSQYDEKLYFNSLANKVIVRPDVVDYAKAKEGKRVIADLQETIESVGGVLDFKTGKIMQKAEPEMQLFIGNKGATIDTLLEKTLVENEYLKKSDGPAPAAPVVVPGAPPADQSQLSEAQRKNSARLAS